MQDQGTDYGRGVSNVDAATGIRYGVIPVNNVFYWHDTADLKDCGCDDDCYCDFLTEYIETDNLVAESDYSGDIWVFKSEFYTYAKFCSPCAPGACYLIETLEPEEGIVKAYCLGYDFFETDGIPYRVFRVVDIRRFSLKKTIQIEGILEIDQNRGVIYFHSTEHGHTPLRICSLPKPIPDPSKFDVGLDITHMRGCNWKNKETTVSTSAFLRDGL